jgi:FkbM family methyltransferase
MARVGRLARELKLLRKAFRNWLLVAVAGLLWKHLPLSRRELTVVTRGGTRIVVPLGSEAGALYPVLEVFAFSEYAHDWRLGDEPCVVDIGAHVGAFTLWLAERSPRLRAVCFEPDPDAYRYLARNTKRIAATLHRQAVGASGRTSLLRRPIAGGGVSTLQAIGDGDEVAVEVVSLQDALAPLADVSLMKLDCEGCEYELVLDTPAASWVRVQRVVLEYHAVSGREPSELVDRLEGLGLRLVHAEPKNGVGTYWFAR